MTAAAQVASVLSSGASSGVLQDLLIKIQAEAADLRTRKTAEDAKSTDPLLERADALAARQQSETIGFDLRRLEGAAARLEEAISDACLREGEARRADVYQSVKEERDQLAQDLAEQYPVLARKIVDLLERIEKSDQAVEAANKALPRGEMPLVSAECVARKAPGHWRNSAGGPIDRLCTTTLPAFSVSPTQKPFMFHPHIERSQRNQE